MIFNRHKESSPTRTGQQPVTGIWQSIAARAQGGGFVALLAAGLGMLSLPLQAAPQTEATIHQAVEDFLQQRLGQPGPELDYQISQLDPRLRLAACDRPLEVEFPPGVRQSGYTTVVTRCRGTDSWKIHVPVTIRRFAEVLVAVRNLPRGKRLAATDVRLERREISRLSRGYYQQAAEIEGRMLERGIRQGRVLNPDTVTRPRLVRRGEEVTIIARAGNLTIHVKGEALMDGIEGKRIRVRNLRSKEELEATVVGPGKVQVTI